MFDLLDQLPETLRRIHGTAVLAERGGETVDSLLVWRSRPPEKAPPIVVDCLRHVASSLVRTE